MFIASRKEVWQQKAEEYIFSEFQNSGSLGNWKECMI